MSIFVETTRPSAFLAAVRDRVTQEKGPWWVDPVGNFRHTQDSGASQAWFEPVAGKNELVLHFILSSTNCVEPQIYAFYHGHFVLMLLSHFFDRGGLIKVSTMAIPLPPC